MAPLFSIIVPVYNSEKTFRRCVDSILNQTFCDWETLLIDDGSTDASSHMCDEYAACDSRFRVFHKNNEGVAASRQMGLVNAKGEYVIHVDSDDWIDETMLENMYSCIKNNNSDVLICNYYVNTDYEQTIVRQNVLNLKPIDVLHNLFQNLHGSLWNKLVRRTVFEKYNINFIPQINYCEDVLIWVQLLQHPEIKIIFDDNAYYHYYMNEKSITHAYTKDTYKIRCMYYKKLCYLLPEDFEFEKRKVRLDILFEAYINQVLSNIETWKELLLYNKKAAFCETRLRWRIGYISLALGIWPLARYFLKY